MSARTIVVTGTDTDVGKTVFAAALAGALGATYWKPVQAGLDPRSDSAGVADLGGLRPAAILPEAYRLHTPCSPHRAAELDGVAIDPDRLALPSVDGPLVVEGAGGVLVPVTRSWLFADQFARWNYDSTVEQSKPGEDKMLEQIDDTLRAIQSKALTDYGHPVRPVHAKSHAIVEGTPTIVGGLPEQLTQGLFARPSTNPVVLRFLTNSGDILDDAVLGPDGLAIKMICLDGERLPDSEGDRT